MGFDRKSRYRQRKQMFKNHYNTSKINIKFLIERCKTKTSFKKGIKCFTGINYIKSQKFSGL